MPIRGEHHVITERIDVYRDPSRLEEDDWKLNVQPRLGDHTESVAVFNYMVVVGWRIQPRLE